MDPEEKALLEEAVELSRENNKMLRKVRGVQKRQAIWSFIKIILIIAIAFGSFYYLEPYLNKLMNLYGQITGTGVKVDPTTLQNALKNIR
jgi:hypothetical protein